MLVCDVHHRVFDRDMLAEHPEEVLVGMASSAGRGLASRSGAATALAR